MASWRVHDNQRSGTEQIKLIGVYPQPPAGKCDYRQPEHDRNAVGTMPYINKDDRPR